MQYSPKLKRLTGQIRKVLKDNDVAGVVVLHTPGFGEFVLELTPSYSSLEWDKAAGIVTIKGKAVRFNGDIKKRDEAIVNTLNMLNILAQLTGEHSLQLMNLSETADKAWNGEHGTGRMTSDQEQNN